MRAALLLLALGCTTVNAEFHCEYDGACVLNGDQGTCEGNGYCSFYDPQCGGQRRYGPHAGPLSGICVGEEPPPGLPDSGDPDQAPANDRPGAAAPLGDGGEVGFDLTKANPDRFGCLVDAPDVFYSFYLGDHEVVYLDTIGSNTTLSLWAGECDRDQVEPGECASSSCRDGAGAQLARVLDPGAYCVMVAGSGSGTLRFQRGGRAGTEILPGGNYFNTCEELDLTSPSCGDTGMDGAGEAAFFFTVCDGQSVSAGSEDPISAILFMRSGSADSEDVACGLRSTGYDFFEPGLAWVLVQSSGECGAGSLFVSGAP